MALTEAQKAELSRIMREAKERGYDVTPPQPPAPKPEVNPLAQAFEEIQAFIEKRGREPNKGGSPVERKLAMRLATFRTTPEEAAAVRPLDRYGLLPAPPTSMAELLADAKAKALLAGEEVNIKDTDKLPKVKKTQPEYVAKRKPCPDFETFRPLFEVCHQDLAAGKRRFTQTSNGGRQLQKGQWKEVEVGDFVLLRGQLGYVAKKGPENHYTPEKGNNFRLRMIYENGTESDQLMRSLLTDLYKDGMLVSARAAEDLTLEESPAAEKSGAAHEGIDVCTGTIYVLRSLSANPEIRKVPNLYKIGMTAESMEKRLAHAEQEPTYLMAGVEIVARWSCYNIKLSALENLLHVFFSEVCLNITVVDAKGRRCHPREWFSVPLPIIEEAIKLTQEGTIAEYRYNSRAGKIERREG